MLKPRLHPQAVASGYLDCSGDLEQALLRSIAQTGQPCPNTLPGSPHSPVEAQTAQAAARAEAALELLIGFGYAGRDPESGRCWITESGELALLTDC